MRSPEHEHHEHIITGVYNGPTSGRQFTRGVYAVQRRLSEKGLTLDTILIHFLSKAAMEGQDIVTGLDIGSGRAALFTQLLSNPSIAPQTRAYLTAHREVKIDLFGLTDANSPNMQLQPGGLTYSHDLLTQKDEDVNEQIWASNFYYTLTRTQTLGHFLDAIDVKKLDFALSTNSLRYFSPPVFEEVVQTVVERFRPGGRFITYYYAGNPPGFAGGHNDGFHTKAPIDSETNDFVQILNSYVLNDYVISNDIDDPDSKFPVSKRQDIMETDPLRYQELIERGWDLYKRLTGLTQEGIIRKALTDEEIKAATEEVDELERSSQPIPPERKLDLIAQRTLRPAFERVERKMRWRDIGRKKAIINAVGDVHLTWTYIHEENGGGFTLVKR